MEKFSFKRLTIEDSHRIKEIDASHFVKRAWRVVDGVRQLIDLNYDDPDFPGGFDEHHEALKETIQNDGFAIGALDESGKLLGFATLNSDVFGMESKYVLLDQMFISRDQRGKGLGKMLMMICVEEARAWQVDKLYICAGSAEDTIAFYFGIGCQEAKEINQALYESDPNDYQLEYVL